MNINAGDCVDCGRYWTVSGGGLNDEGQCQACEKRFATYKQANDYEMPDDSLSKTLANEGAGLGV